MVIPDLIRDPGSSIGWPVGKRHGAGGTLEIPALRCASAGITGTACATRFLRPGPNDRDR